ncbi:hypothetical protein [Nonomuraea pusilla]|uniref:Novel STAND NTPase 1 domain-containing protein n=1 Tax=Nonomuraea pusilla TaxID=46177 RepID=A0A1H7RXZ7_9ACTN|nr:hypothetical protein [Nonomuraea pusilla]SEL65170.1 hypothetical protein SAMN05660976_02971 [Nonomuraea pusilla]
MATSGTNRRQGGPEPYAGLRALHPGDRHAFSGRLEESREVHDLWQGRRVTILHGASGIGKTSLIGAGVVPLLDRNAIDLLPFGRVSYGSVFPRAALPAHNPYVLALLMSWSPMGTPTRLAGMTLARFLRSRPAMRDAFGDRKSTMVVIDQLEELFSGPRRHQPYREWFFAQLADALDADPRLHLLLSIRNDRLDELLPFARKLAGGDRACVPLEALRPEGALEAVRRPLEGTGRAFAPGTAEQLVQDLLKINARSSAHPDESCDGTGRVDPTQLQVACSALWAALPDELSLIRPADVSRHAGTEESLTAYYDTTVTAVSAERFDGDDDVLRSWLLRTFADEASRPRPVRRRALAHQAVGRATVALLVRRRVLRTDRRQGDSWYEPAYDRLPLRPARARPRPSVQRAALHPGTCLEAAVGALGEGDLALAAKRCDEALAHSAEDDHHLRAEAESLLGNIAHERGDVEEAVARYRAAAQSFERAGATGAVGPLLAAVGRLRLAQGFPEMAVRELYAAMARVPADLAIQTELAWALWHDGHPEAAVDVLNDVLDREGNNADALLTRGQILAGMGRARAALRDLDRAGPLQWPFAKVAHALALALLDCLEEAQQEMVEALTHTMDHGPLLLYAARVEELAGKTSSAMDLARRAMSASAPALPEHMARDARRLIGAA